MPEGRGWQGNSAHHEASRHWRLCVAPLYSTLWGCRPSGYTWTACLHGATQPPSMPAHTNHFRSEITWHASCLPSRGHATTLNACRHKPYFLGQKSRDTQVVCLHRATQLPSMPAHTNLSFFGQKSSLFWSEIMWHTSCLPSWCQATTLNACTHKPHLFGLKSCHTQAACLPGAMCNYYS